MTKECHGIRPQRTVVAFGRNNAAYKAAHLFSISLFGIKISSHFGHTDSPCCSAKWPPVIHGEIVCTKMGILYYKKGD